MAFKSRRSKRALMAAGALALLVPGCAVDPKTGAQSLVGITISDDPCAKTGATIGAVLGGVAGALLTAQMSKNSEARVLGAIGGAAIGGMIGNDIDNRRCEMFRIAKKYDQNISATSITVSSLNASPLLPPRPVANSSGNTTPEPAAGLSVVIKDSARQFPTGSEQLTPNARAFFLEIAEQYSYQKQSAKLPANASKEARSTINLLKTKRILLIGHTDDTGSTRENAALAERRAATVARLFRDQGIPDFQVFYQGAGETFPIGDNRTEDGRSANRRVEIVEMADEGNFKKYLESRQPNYGFYRPVEPSERHPGGAVIAAAGQQTASARQERPAVKPAAIAAPRRSPVGTSETASASARPAKATADSPTLAAGAISKSPSINFGGTPYTPLKATIKVMASAPDKAGFSLMSKAYADNAVIASDCTRDRPRATGSVKSIRDGSVYKTSEHLPQLFGKTWAGEVNGNLVVVNRIAVLRDGGAPANLPELKVYSQYNPSSSKKPDVSEEPQVNSYLVGEGVLYRMFPRGDAGLKCVDLLFGTDGAKTARDGKLIYTANASDFVVDFKPQQAQ